MFYLGIEDEALAKAIRALASVDVLCEVHIYDEDEPREFKIGDRVRLKPRVEDEVGGYDAPAFTDVRTVNSLHWGESLPVEVDGWYYKREHLEHAD